MNEKQLFIKVLIDNTFKKSNIIVWWWHRYWYIYLHVFADSSTYCKVVLPQEKSNHWNKKQKLKLKKHEKLKIITENLHKCIVSLSI